MLDVLSLRFGQHSGLYDYGSQFLSKSCGGPDSVKELMSKLSASIPGFLTLVRTFCLQDHFCNSLLTCVTTTATTMIMSVLYALVIISLHFGIVKADSNGMDMSMDGAMDLSSGSMLPYLHFTPGDNLWFLGWVPQTAGAMVGACIGLFLLALVDRWIAACRAVMDVHWSKR